MTTAVQNPIKAYTGNGSATSFAYTARVLDADAMRVYINGVLQTNGTNYTLTGVDNSAGGAVIFFSPPANGSSVIVQRLNTLDRETDFQEASAIPTDTLDRDLDRLTQMIQDTRAASLEIVSGNLLDAKGQRIINLQDPVDGQDAVTKSWAQGAMTSQLSQATIEATTATTRAAEAVVSAAAALASKNAAATSATSATASQADALVSKNASAASQADALVSKGVATTKAAEAAASAAAALVSQNASAASALASHNDAAYSATTKQEIIDALADGSVASINGRGGLVVLTAADVGLANASNTSDANKPISTAQQVAITQAAPPGAVMHFAMATAPPGWLKANGAAVSRTAYAALFAAIGGTFGAGDGSTTFNVPDLRGEIIRAFDDGRGVDAGRAFGSLQLGQNASHAHGINDPAHAHGVADPGHAHGVYDPGHAHGAWTDVQGYHDHSIGMDGNSAGWGLTASGAYVSEAVITRGVRNVSANGSHGHTVGIGLSGTGVGIYGAGTGIGIYGAGTGISIQAQGGSEVRVRNVALLAAIKY